MAIARPLSWCALAALGVFASRAVAQGQPTRPYAEYRADAIIGSGTAAQAGAGAVIPLGIYVRLGMDGAAGVTWRDGQSAVSGRVDAIARFLLDPFREARVALSMGGGVSAPIGRAEPSHAPYLTAVLDVEWTRHAGSTPALQIGLGGGTRIGIVLRRSPIAWR